MACTFYPSQIIVFTNGYSVKNNIVGVEFQLFLLIAKQTAINPANIAK